MRFVPIFGAMIEIREDGPKRSWDQAMLRGLTLRCPACGEGHMFAKFLKVADACPHCGEELHHHRADDAPPYFTIFIVGHIVVPLVLVTEKLWHPNLFVSAVLWLVVTLALTLFLMPRVKGAVVAAQWAVRMHGFDYAARDDGEVPSLDKGPAARA
jgi:uncharacterized protein (DUF983 family)